MTNINGRENFFRKHLLATVIVGALLAVAIVLLFRMTHDEVVTVERQDQLQPFYTLPDPIPAGPPGTIIRQEPLETDLPNVQAVRILYKSEQSDGTVVVSSGMVFWPAGNATASPRPVVAWAHPTVGMGRSCSPSRTANPVSDMTWLADMINRGWVVTATDYAGLGTPGVERYLVGRDEARDVINSVRAARNLGDASAGSDYAVWGHSQGGHAALFTAQVSGSYAPELGLVATAVAAPAAEMPALIALQYKSIVSWVIGPEVLVAWPGVYAGMTTEGVVSKAGLEEFKQVADQCLTGAGEEALANEAFKQNFFASDPTTIPGWYNALTSETPDILAPSQPLFIAQGLSDVVVLPETTALLVQRSCQAGGNVTVMWMGGTNHGPAAKISGPDVAAWLQDRFAGKPASPTCDQILPVTPAVPPAAPTGS